MIRYSKILSSLLFFIILQVNSTAQNFEPIDIPFTVDGKLLENPLIGGLLAPQFAPFDLDGEAPMDMIVFERNGNVLLPFISHSTPGNPSYKYAPQYRSAFPKLLNFVQLKDFNDDGKNDIFALSPAASGIEVWRNTSEGNEISFDRMEFDFNGSTGDFLQYPAGGFYYAVYVSSIDIPAIVDKDGDGDLDIITFEAGGSLMYYFQNMTKEKGLSDTMVFEVKDLCWGNFFESGVSEEISLASDRSECPNELKSPNIGGGTRHSGSTVLAFDGDGDQDIDLVLGDLTNNGLVYLENDEVGGDDFMISQDINFPKNSVEASIRTFLSASHIDVDADGKRDLIVAPNNELGSENVDHIWYYRNVGTDSAPVFELEQFDFILDESLVMGHASSATFCDFNADGLQDILVGNDGLVVKSNKTPTMFLYQNIGSATAPAYELVNDNYLNMQELYTNTGATLYPTLGDLDSDGDDDLIIGTKVGFLFYFENLAGPGNPYNFAQFQYEYMDLRVGNNTKPFIYDVDEDGLADLVIGEQNDNFHPVTQILQGGVNFIKNVGSVGNPMFGSDEEVFPNIGFMGKVFTRDIDQSSGSSAPTFFVSEGEVFLSVGSRGGGIHIYNEIKDSIYGTFNEVYEKLPIGHPGRRSITAWSDIDGDDFYEILVSNDNGGLMAFNTTFRVQGDVSTTDFTTTNLQVSPNPTSDYVTLKSDDLIKGQLRIYNRVGQLVISNQDYFMDQQIDVQSLQDGFYIIEVKYGTKVGRERFVKM